MRVEREFHDKKLAHFLQTADESALHAIMAEAEAETDAELATAIQYSLDHDKPGDSQTVAEFLDSLRQEYT